MVNQEAYTILACSPRRHGNTDRAVCLIGEVLTRAGLSGFSRRVADSAVMPCVSCGFCDTHPGHCALEECTDPKGRRDEALPLLLELSSSRPAILVSPIYFYHLPSQAKALVDRSQSFWTLPKERKPGGGRTLGAILLGGRPRGENLFMGAVLTLRYMAEALGMKLADPLLLYGLDGPGDLRTDVDAGKKVGNYARLLAG